MQTSYVCMQVSCTRHLALAGGRHETPASDLHHLATVGPAALPCTLLEGDFSTGQSIPVDFVIDLFVRRPVGACKLSYDGSELVRQVKTGETQAHKNAREHASAHEDKNVNLTTIRMRA